MTQYGPKASEHGSRNGHGPDTHGWALRALSTVTPRQVRWLVPGLVPLRALTLVAGVGGLGKSTWALARASELSLQGQDTIIVSFEDPAAEMQRPRVDAAGGDAARVHEMWLPAGGIEVVQLPRDLDDLQRLIRSVRAKLVVIDPVVAALETSFDAHKDQHVRAVLSRLAAIVEEEQAAAVLIGHLNKAPSTDAYIRVANSTAFWNACRSVVLVTEDDDEDMRLVAQRKANWARRAAVERHRVEEITLWEQLDPETGEPIRASRMLFVEQADDVDGADVLSQNTTKAEQAESLLAVTLADGEWHESTAVKELLATRGVSERTVQRAANRLRVDTDRRGMPSSTWWRLPAVAPNSSPNNGATGKTP